MSTTASDKEKKPKGDTRKGAAGRGLVFSAHNFTNKSPMADMYESGSRAYGRFGNRSGVSSKVK